MRTPVRALAVMALSFQMSAFAEEFPLSEAIGTLQPPIVDDANGGLTNSYLANKGATSLPRSATQGIQYVTKVKAQGQRNLCTVFSFTALLEAVMIRNHPELAKSLDLSEQWGQYLVALRSESGGVNGSIVKNNFNDVKKYGSAEEDAMPYSGSKWSENSSQTQQVCGHLSGLNFTRCMASHTDPTLIRLSDAELLNKSSEYYSPDFLEARQSAQAVKAQYLKNMTGGRVARSSEIKALLAQGIPVTIEADVYYGTWNHSHGRSLGVDVDESAFAAGVVTFPEPGSVDAVNSRKERNRHSVLIFGYDDDVVVTYEKKMKDGTTQTFTRKGVYYFKNSWGTKYGRNFKLNGKRYPGLGMMTQDFAHQYGEFFAVDL